jgi:hypothetical protein
MKRRVFLGKGIKGLLGGILGGAAALSLKEDAGAYCAWYRRNRICTTNNQTWDYLCYTCQGEVVHECRWVYVRQGC